MITKTKKLLVDRIAKNRRRLWEWQIEQTRKAPPPFYCSVDLRDSGHKIVPVDSNLFPAGFNNICPEDLRNAPPVFRAHLEALASQFKRSSPTKILILPESHTQNVYYIENLYFLSQIIQNAGFEVQIGWYGPMPEGSQQTSVLLRSESGKELHAYPVEIRNGILSAGSVTPDIIVLNNDFSSGYPKPLDEVGQLIVPSYALGWHSRKKSEHFVHYNALAAEFAGILEVDPFLIQVDSEEVGPVNFDDDMGIDAVAQAVDRVLERTRRSYETHKIKDAPFAFVKNNHGTYGMGIMVVHSSEELRHLNRRAKHKMTVGKNRLPIDSVLVQEGIPTKTLVQRLAAEPVIYLVGSELIGGFLRTNTEKGVEENLNSTGMVFKKLCMSDLTKPDSDLAEMPDEVKDEDKEPVLELVYGSIARISALATGREFAAHGLTGGIRI